MVKLYSVHLWKQEHNKFKKYFGEQKIDEYAEAFAELEKMDKKLKQTNFLIILMKDAKLDQKLEV